MRKDKIKEYVSNYTMSLIRSANLEGNGAEASTIADTLNIDRANVSRELNSLWKNGYLIKIQGRPTLFLDYELIKLEYPNSYIPNTIAMKTSIYSYIAKVSNQNKITTKTFNNSIENILGFNGSLKQQIANSIAALAYPPNGLPILLIGHSGTGKRKFAQSLYYYAIEQKIKEENSKFIIVNCRDFINSEETFAKYLLGSSKSIQPNKNTKGIIEQCNQGILYLSGIEYLSDGSISLLSEIINNGSYATIGETKSKNLQATFIASTNDTIERANIKALFACFPVVINIPDFDDRPSFEKIEAILSYFSREAINITKPIKVSKSIVYILAKNKYQDNESQLRNEIRLICSKAFLHSSTDSKVITIDFSDLPNNISSVKEDDNLKGQYLQSTLDLYNKNSIIIEADGSCEAYIFFKNIVTNSSYKNIKQFIDLFNVNLDKLINENDFIISMISTLRTCDEEHLHHLKTSVNSEISVIIGKHLSSDDYYKLLLDNQRVLLGLSLLITNFINNNDKYESIYELNISAINKKEYQTINAISIEASKKGLGTMSNKEKEFLCSYISISKAILESSKASVLVICHGNSIAKEMCELLKETYESLNINVAYLDIREGLQFNDVLELAKTAVNKINSGAGVVVLVDKQPLDGIEEYLRNECSVKVRVIPSVSLNKLSRVITACSKYTDINDIASNNEYSPSTKANTLSRDDFINMLINNIISKTVLYVNPKRAADVLTYSLQTILEDLNLQYSVEIAVKFISHGVHMIERTIKNNNLPYYHLKNFINQNYKLMDIISNSLEPVNNTFDIHIPQSEIAYIAEIFLEH